MRRAADHLALPIQGEPADWLRAVRRGQIPFEDWWDRSLRLDAQLQALADDDTIPDGPDRAKIQQWSVDTHLKHWAIASVHEDRLNN